MKKDIENMVATGIIETMDESKWVRLIIVQEKNTKGDIRICVHLKNLNGACVHDFFPISFTDEVLDNVGG